MAHYGQNVRHHSVGGLVSDRADKEMLAYEFLGPACRKVIDDGPIKISAVKILEQIHALRDKNGNEADPRDPRIDHAIAQGIVVNSAQIIMRDRTEQDARDGLKPLRARRTRRW